MAKRRHERKAEPARHVVIRFLTGDPMECRVDGDELVRVLNSSFRIRKDDRRIMKTVPVDKVDR